jgi:hypothetical protein
MTDKIVVNVDGEDFERPIFEVLEAILLRAFIYDIQNKEKA